MKKTKIAIVGGGPSGVWCALQLIEEFDKHPETPYFIDIFDEKEILSTILPTGNGRCNITYDEEDFRKFASFYPRGEKFLYSIFSRYLTSETLEYFEKIGVKTYIQPDRRVFPISNSTKDVRTRMIQALKKSGHVNFIQKSIKNREELRNYNVIVLATGSKDRYGLNKQFGHSVNPLKPALCGLKVKEKTAEFPTGVSINTEYGGIIFTHQGISGPEIFRISSINAKNELPYSVKIPIINPGEVMSLININPKKSFGNIVSSIIPRALTVYLFARHNIDFDKQACHAKKEEIEKLKTLDFTITGTDGKGEIVHCGGVLLDEIDKNCCSKIVPNLWIIGENLDIDGFCGGFNLQNCWSTGAIAACDIVKTTLNKNF